MAGVVNKIVGAKELSAALKKLGPEVTEKLRKLNITIGAKVHRSAVDSIQRGSKTGRTYTRRGISHHASAPGEAPATDTGRLASSVKMVVDETTTNVAVGTSVGYGKDLEFGTSKMEARPWLFPALESNKPAWERGVRDLVASLKRSKKG